ncbi:GIY-YIG nuclease family protein [Halobacterium salinarum]|uniref:GIY-YIG nuclease family protein n=1 Tax=Halobacterium salinarum TaxID=2242 RepID=UPI00255435B8|nr:GIY-YIG nuclease family protein [Halobacterium salinarum]MDL0145541.1 GIY-YIG nuclease family protein [Halobacterium salinarum]
MTESRFYAADWLGVEWSNWGTLDPGGDHLSTFSTDEGLYRVRHPARPGLEYIGETGRSVRGRVRALAHGVFAEEMPYRDPHTAAPCLWAVQQEEAEKLEVSVTTPTLAEDKQSRKAFEDALIAVYRREMGESPTANFGRIIDGYRQSTYRSGEERGGPLEPGQTESNTEDGVGPLDWSRSSDVLSEDWMGLLWSSPRPLADADTSIPTDDGLYRIWREGEAPPLEYIGQSSNLKSRLYRHRRNRHEALLFSYSELGEHDAQHKREEVETELIGVHWLAVGESPGDQF